MSKKQFKDNPVPSLDEIYKEYQEIVDAENDGRETHYKKELGSYDSGDAVENFFEFLCDRLQNGVETNKEQPKCELQEDGICDCEPNTCIEND